MKSNPSLALAILVVGALVVPAVSMAQGKPKTKPMPKPAPSAFAPVQKILTANCVSCHTGASAAAGLDLNSYAMVMKGAKSGKVVMAGMPAKSMLCTVLHGKPKQMPPKKALDAKSVAVIEAWVKAGAKK